MTCRSLVLIPRAMFLSQCQRQMDRPAAWLLAQSSARERS